MTPARPYILIVDDEPSVLLTVAAILEQEGYAVDAVPDGAAAVRNLGTRNYDLVLTDLKMPGIDGLQVLEEVRKRSPNTVTVMMTGYASVDSALEAIQRGAYEYLLKPTEVEDLKAAVRRSLERKRLSEIDTLYRISRLVTTSLDAAQIAHEVTLAAREVLGVSGAELADFTVESSSAPGAKQLRALLEGTEVAARLSRGETLILSETSEKIQAWARDNGIVSLGLAPGIAKNRLACVLCVWNDNPFEFHASTLRFLSGLAGQSALALSHAAILSELQHNNAQLASANAKLRELDQLKSQFLSVATHELRTPLSIILGYNSMLADSLADRLDEQERDTLRESVAACKRLIRLVNSMLDITQIESGKMRMNFESSDLRRLVSGVAALFQQDARAKDIHIGVELPQRLPRLVMDAERIEQVLVNLLGNALKFTPQGGSVTITVRNFERGVQVAVADTGIGIAAEDRATIFDEFAQVRRQTAKRQREGSGLGLAIARRIVEAHHGKLEVESEIGHGSVFRFTIPANAKEQTVGNAVSA
jgi:signal transduction histidine kinase/CheY-like chemotaxis protein